MGFAHAAPSASRTRSDQADLMVLNARELPDNNVSQDLPIDAGGDTRHRRLSKNDGGRFRQVAEGGPYT